MGPEFQRDFDAGIKAQRRDYCAILRLGLNTCEKEKELAKVWNVILL